MNDQRSFDRRFAEDMDAERTSARLPSSFYDEFRQRADHTRQRPRWLALIKEPPMRTDSQLAVGSPTVRVAAVLAATFLLAVALAGIGIAGQRLFAADGVIVVAGDGSGDYTTISEAVAAAGDGDTLSIRPGTYAEHVLVDMDITFVGDGERESIIITAGAGPIMEVVDSDATISGLTFHGPDSEGVVARGGAPVFEDLLFDDVGPGEEGGSLGVSDGSAALIRDNDFRAGGDLWADSAAEPQIIGNDLDEGPGISLFEAGDGTLVSGNTITGATENAIGIFGPATFEVSDNEIRDATGFGIAVGWSTSGGTDPVLRGNVIVGADTGVSVASQAAPIVEGNRVEQSLFGINAGPGSEPTITSNELIENGVGIGLNRSDASVTGNSVEGGRRGIVTSVGGAPTLEGNTVEGAEEGLVIADGATPSLISNTFCDNGQNLVLSRGAEVPDTAANEICSDETGS